MKLPLSSAWVVVVCLLAAPALADFQDLAPPLPPADVNPPQELTLPADQSLRDALTAPESNNIMHESHARYVAEDDRLFGVFASSDHRFDDFISPMTNPFFFEDPRTLTEARFIFVNHRLPNSLGGDSLQLFAMQVRAALTERLSIIATKDGYFTTGNSTLGGSGVVLNDGWADLSAGLKYNLLADARRGSIVSIGARYELASGARRTLQGNGDGEFDLFLSAGQRLGCGWHWLSATGFRLPADTVEENQIWYWSNHIDRKISDTIYLFGETNWYHWMKSGQATALPGIGGLDLFNLGQTGVAGNDVVTGALGVKWKPSARTELGVAYEIPLGSNEDLIDDRFTFDWIVRY